MEKYDPTNIIAIQIEYGRCMQKFALYSLKHLICSERESNQSPVTDKYYKETVHLCNYIRSFFVVNVHEPWLVNNDILYIQ